METTWPPTDMREVTAAGLRVREARMAALRAVRGAPNSRSSRLRAARLLMNPPDELGGLRVIKVLTSCRGIADVKAPLMLRRAGVAQDARIDETDLTQRTAIAAAVVALNATGGRS